MPALYTLRLLNPDVTKRGEIPVTSGSPRNGLIVHEAVRELNQMGSMLFEFPTLDTRMAAFAGTLKGLDVQLWRDGFCCWWGVIVADHSDMATTTVTCEGQLTVFDNNFGPIINNYLVNPNFSTGDLSGWTPVGVDSSGFDPTLVIRTTPGGTPGSAQLTTASAGTDAFLQQILAVPEVHVDQAVLYTLSGWYQIDPTITYDGPAWLERGLYVGLIDAGDVFVHAAWARINNRQVGTGHLARLSTQISVPAGDFGSSLDVRPYSPGCRINWGALGLTIQESTGSVGVQDVTDILQAIVTYGQDATREKQDQHIIFGQSDGSPNPLTGTLLERHYQSFDVGGMLQAIEEFPSMGVCDIGITWDPVVADTKFFQVFPDQRGQLLANMAVELAHQSTGQTRARFVQDYSQDSNINQAANDVILLGRGAAGSDREFGRARDLSLLPRLRQHVETAPPDATLDTLDSRAAKRLAVLGGPVNVPKITVPGRLIEQITEGDSIPVRVDYGYMQQTDAHRVVRMTIQPSTDSLVLEGNPNP